MKKGKLFKLASPFLVLALVLSFSLVTAVPAAAATADYNAAVIKAADRLVEMQNTDGGFAWQVDPQATTGSGGSGINTLGITAMGILKAHELLDKAEYETALAKAYGYAKTNTAYYAYPDVTFLMWLADAAEADTSLFDAIVAAEPGTTIQDIRTLALSIWTTRLGGGPYGNAGLGGSAAEMAEYDFDRRATELAFWDTEAAVKAALALGLDADAQDIADVMYAHLDSGSDHYFDTAATSNVYYALALGGAIGAFSELGVYSESARTMTDLLIANQYGAGYWDQGGDASSDEQSVQTTAYAVMALIAQGDEDALAAAKKGGDWFVSTQNLNGGWYPGYVGATLENLEVDSEAAWALTYVPCYDGTTISGNTVATIEITAPDDLSGWALIPGIDNTITGTLNVKCNTTWQVTASDAGPETLGHMTEWAGGAYTDVELANPMVVSAPGEDEVILPGGGKIRGDTQTLETGTNTTVTFSQQVNWGDTVLGGNYYRIVVTFTGMCNP